MLSHMTDLNDRIAQWEKMTQEAPDDMSWFSLGNAYKEAERFEDADQAFAKAIELNAQMSRAYQVRGAGLNRVRQRRRSGRSANCGV